MDPNLQLSGLDDLNAVVVGDPLTVSFSSFPQADPSLAVVSAPAGSAATPSAQTFAPDVAGVYTLRATNPFGASRTVQLVAYKLAGIAKWMPKFHHSSRQAVTDDERRGLLRRWLSASARRVFTGDADLDFPGSICWRLTEPDLVDSLDV